jgi:hypothetical protein
MQTKNDLILQIYTPAVWFAFLIKLWSLPKAETQWQKSTCLIAEQWKLGGVEAGMYLNPRYIAAGARKFSWDRMFQDAILRHRSKHLANSFSQR